MSNDSKVTYKRKYRFNSRYSCTSCTGQLAAVSLLVVYSGVQYVSTQQVTANEQHRHAPGPAVARGLGLGCIGHRSVDSSTCSPQSTCSLFRTCGPARCGPCEDDPAACPPRLAPHIHSRAPPAHHAHAQTHSQHAACLALYAHYPQHELPHGTSTRSYTAVSDAACVPRARKFCMRHGGMDLAIAHQFHCASQRELALARAPCSSAAQSANFRSPTPSMEAATMVAHRTTTMLCCALVSRPEVQASQACRHMLAVYVGSMRSP